MDLKQSQSMVRHFIKPLDEGAEPGHYDTFIRVPAHTEFDELLNRQDLDQLMHHGIVVEEDGLILGVLEPVHLNGLIVERLRQVEEERNALRRSLAKGQNYRSTMFANLSHELRTPLNAIVGYSDLIRSQVLGEVRPAIYREYVDAIYDSGNHLVSLLDSILDLAKIRANEMMLQETPVRVGAVARSVARMLQALADRRQLELHVRIAPDLPSVNADERILRQILLNLVSNAIKYTNQGTDVTISAWSTRRGGLRIEVRDRGPGIPPEQIDYIMQPFKQLEEGDDSGIRGTGLGLPLVKAFAELHDAEFRLISTPKRGTRAVVTFPPSRVLCQRPSGFQDEFKFTRTAGALFL